MGKQAKQVRLEPTEWTVYDIDTGKALGVIRKFREQLYSALRNDSMHTETMERIDAIKFIQGR